MPSPTIKPSELIPQCNKSLILGSPCIKRQHVFRSHSEDYEPKENQRQLVGKHILDVCGYDRIKLLSMPGTSWGLENRLHAVSHYVSITAFELDSIACQKAVYSMPLGVGRILHQRWRCEAGYYDVYHHRLTNLFNADVLDFMQGHLAPVSWKSPTRWSKISTGFNAVWLDPFSPLGSTFYERVFPSMSRMIRKRKAAAICLSFTVGRDSGHINSLIKMAPGECPISKRAEVIRLKFRQYGISFGISKLHQYKTENQEGTLTMGTVMGVAIIR